MFFYLIPNIFYAGPETGVLSNTRRWKSTTPHSLHSPFFVQADLGFFSYKNKKYGIFFCAVQTFTRRVFALAIRNTKSDTLVKAIGSMLKVLGYKKVVHKNSPETFYFFRKKNLNTPRKSCSMVKPG